MKKRIFSLLMVTVMIFSCFSMVGYAGVYDYAVGAVETTDSADENPAGTIPPGTYWTGPVPFEDLVCQLDEHSHNNDCYACAHVCDENCLEEDCKHECGDECRDLDCKHECSHNELTNYMCGYWHWGQGHSASCYTCTHQHGDDCYVADCKHTAHGDECYKDACKHDHSQDADCRVADCKHTEHDAVCYVPDCKHTSHDAACYVKDCVHTAHVDACYDLDCVHTRHDNNCRTLKYWHFEMNGHRHTDACYTACNHQHGDACYDLDCVHDCDAACYDLDCKHECDANCTALDCKHVCDANCDKLIENHEEHVHGDNCYVTKYRWTLALKTFTVTWVDEDGTPLETDENVPYGTVPTFDKEEPTKAADVQYTYEFNGWDAEVVAVTDNVTYTAVYKETVNKYDVTWLDEDGTELAKTEVEYGKVPVYPNADPTKEATAQYTYKFAGWEKVVEVEAVAAEEGDAEATLDRVTGDVTYKATYSSEVNKYTVTWFDEDGKTVLETDENVEYGAKPEFNGTEPTKAADDKYTYKFAGWVKVEAATAQAEEAEAEDVVTGDVAYKATYTATEIPATPAAPETGDNSNAGMYFGMMLAAFAGFVALRKRGAQN